jgi:hypothetical protein
LVGAFQVAYSIGVVIIAASIGLFAFTLHAAANDLKETSCAGADKNRIDDDGDDDPTPHNTENGSNTTGSTEEEETNDIEPFVRVL